MRLLTRRSCRPSFFASHRPVAPVFFRFPLDFFSRFGYTYTRSCWCGGIGRRPRLKIKSVFRKQKCRKPLIYKGFISLYFYIFLCAPPKSTSISANFFPTDFFIQPMSASRSLQILIICWCGGIGRRPRLKISFKQLSTGSIPVTSTTSVRRL